MILPRTRNIVRFPHNVLWSHLEIQLLKLLNVFFMVIHQHSQLSCHKLGMAWQQNTTRVLYLFPSRWLSFRGAPKNHATGNVIPPSFLLLVVVATNSTSSTREELFKGICIYHNLNEGILQNTRATKI